MSIENLQVTLREHADEVVDLDASSRASAARRRAGAMRRNRIAAAVVAAAVVVPVMGAALLNGNPLNNSGRDVGPAGGEVDRAVHVSFPETFAGATLIEETATRDGKALELTLDDLEVSTEWWATCYGVDSSYSVHLTMDDQQLGDGWSLPCSPSIPLQKELGYPDQPTWRLQGPEAHGTHTLRVWITNESGFEVNPPKAGLAAAVYELASPERTVAGAPIQNEERYSGEIYSIAHVSESAPGDGRFVASYDSSPLAERGLETVGLQIVASGLGDAEVSWVVGDESDTFSGVGPDPQTWFWGFLPAGPNTVTFRVKGEVPPDAQLGVVWRAFTRLDP